jgi:hypothetical protein
MRESYHRWGSFCKARESQRRRRRQEVRRELQVQLPLDREELAMMVQEVLHNFASDIVAARGVPSR